MRCPWLLLTLLAAAYAVDEPTPLTVGQAVFKASTKMSLQTLPDGTRQTVQVELYSLVLDQDRALRFDLRSEKPLGVVVYDLDHTTATGDPAVLGAAGIGRPYHGKLTAGRYMLAVASDPPTETAYLLSVAPEPEPDAKFKQVEQPGPVETSAPFLGSWQVPQQIQGADLSPDGRWVVVHDGRQAWLHDLKTLRSYRLPSAGGDLRRVRISPDGWSVLVASTNGVVLLSLPDGSPFARFEAPGGVRDAVYAGNRQRVAMLPIDGAVSLCSPVAGDLAYLPDSAGTMLAGDPSGVRIAVRSGQRDVRVYDVLNRQLLGNLQWPAPPIALAPHPFVPLVAGAGPSASLLWSLANGNVTDLPECLDVSYGGTGLLGLTDGRQVTIVSGDQLTPCEPAFPATHVAFSSTGRLLLATTDDGRLALWRAQAVDLSGTPTEDKLLAARMAYSDGLKAMKAQNYEAAVKGFSDAVGLLAQLELTNDTREFACLAQLRLSQATYQLKDYQTSLEAAKVLLQTAAELPAGETRQSYLSIGLYRQADALWELGQREDAKKLYQQALDAGLGGGRADDAKAKLAQ